MGAVAVPATWGQPLAAGGGLLAYSYQHQTHYDLTFAAVTMIALPMIALYAVFQRWFISGLTSGAIKG